MNQFPLHKGTPDKSKDPLWNGEEKYYWQGKAGGYGIQDPFGAMAVMGIFGCYYNVMGLPVSVLAQILRKIGVMP
jgi:predicted house-cleaning NTP pyrophosphatase (Maf/HAM1 superfamily)